MIGSSNDENSRLKIIMILFEIFYCSFGERQGLEYVSIDDDFEKLPYSAEQVRRLA